MEPATPRGNGVLPVPPTQRRVAGRACAGFSYLAVLFVLAIMAVGWAALGVVWSTDAARSREEELLYVGQQFRVAICRYYENVGGAEKKFPSSLDALLADERSAKTIRHLRRIYADPITGKSEWGLLKTPDDAIHGVFSLSGAEPLKNANFDLPNRQFVGAKHYSDWIFFYMPGQPNANQRRCDPAAVAASP